MSELPPANRSRGIVWGIALGAVGTLVLLVIISWALGVGVTRQTTGPDTRATGQPVTAQPVDKPEQAATTPPVPVPQVAPRSEYPKVISLSAVEPRFRLFLGSNKGKTTAVQLAPGVYAEQSTTGDLGTLDDYSSYVGLCVDVKRYARVHPGGSTCW